jgi:hypothetical protein
VWSGGFVIQSAVLIHVDIETIKLQVTCQIRGQEDRIEIVEFHLDADPVAARQRYYKLCQP